MNKKRNLWIFVGIVILAAVLISGFIFVQPSAEDILVQALETAKTLTDGHAIVTIDMDTIEQDASGTVELWARHSETGPGAFRLEVLESSEEKAVGAVIVSDGATLWAYSPSENKVFVGTLEEAQEMMEDNEFMAGKLGDFRGEMEFKHDAAEFEHPENSEEAVQNLMEYFKIGKSTGETVAGESTNLLKLEPIPEQMPAEYTAIGGFVNLWIGKSSGLPLAAAYTGGSLGEVNVNVSEFEVNSGVDEALFSFEIPDGVEVITFADIKPQSLTLDQADETAEFNILSAGETPPGATLVDILEVRGTIVHRYTLPEGGSFTITQGISSDNSTEMRTPFAEGQSVDLRGTKGQFFEAEDGSKVLLTWTEGALFYSVAGDLTLDQALAIAESLQ